MLLYLCENTKSMKKLLLILFLFSSFFCFTQDPLKPNVDDFVPASAPNEATDTSYWETGGLFSVNFSQVSLTNWAAGGNNSISLNSLVSLNASYNKGLNFWDNNLDLGYGILQQSPGVTQKTDDKIDFNSKYGRKFKSESKWGYAALFNFKSQFAPGFAMPTDTVKISDFLAPAYMLYSIGFDYKPKKFLKFFLSPVTGKTTIVRDQQLADKGAFGVEPATYDSLGRRAELGKTIRHEIGGYLRAEFNKEIVKNITFQSKLELFSNYLNNPQNIDINWENILNMKVNKYIAATFLVHVLYDDDIDIAVDTNDDGINDTSGPRTQIKQLLGVGFSYKF